jgi:4a-hydroxytetrahydrobiopterin dehydratase
MAQGTQGTQELLASKCGPCARCGGNADDMPMTREQVLEQLPSLCPSWKLVSLQEQDGGLTLKIERKFIAKSFVAAMEFLNKAAAIAEEEGHHPDLHVESYRTVRVVVYTHAIMGLHKNDFILAAKLDTIPVSYSPKFLKDNPEITAGRDGSSPS